MISQKVHNEGEVNPAKVGVEEEEAKSGPSNIAITSTSSGSISNMTGTSRRDSVKTRRNVKIDHFRGRYPHSIVWTPITVITWFIPFFGHVGIAYTNGKIRDFTDAFVVNEDRMAYGRPTKYWELDTNLANGKEEGWDIAIVDASEEYTIRDHDHLCDNSYSMVALALNLMRYDGSKSWNMFWVFILMMVHSKYVGCGGFWRQWGPFLLLFLIGSIIALPFSFGNAAATLQARTNETSFGNTTEAYSRGRIEIIESM